MTAQVYLRKVLQTTAFIYIILATTSLSAATWYGNANSGDDTTGDGSSLKPFKSWTKLRAVVKSGDTVILSNGDYGDLVEGIGPSNVYSSWVEIRAAAGASPSFTSARFGANGSQYQTRLTGSFDVYMKFSGISFSNAVSVYGGRFIEFDNCTVSSAGTFSGTSPTGKPGFYIGWASNIKILNSRIQNVMNGVVFTFVGNSIIKNTEIRDVFADGITLSSSQNCVVDGCTIFNLDDGVEDSDPEGKGWGIHNDGIQIQIWGGARETILPNAQIIIRNNKIYGSSGQGIQFNNYLQTAPDIHNRDICIENNIFGPTGAYNINSADVTDNLIVRHNTFKAGSYTYTCSAAYTKAGASGPRAVTVTNSGFRASSGNTAQGTTSGGSIYNNLFSQVLEVPSSAVFSNNVITSDNTKTAYPRSIIVTTTDGLYANPGSITDSTILSTSKAVNAGTKLSAVHTNPAWYSALMANFGLGNSSVDIDANAQGRDARPDAGAYEAQNVTALPEAILSALNDTKTLFVDDFEDDSFNQDPFLDKPSQSGLSWSQFNSRAVNFDFTRNDSDGRNWFTSAPGTGFAATYVNQGTSLNAFKIEFDALNSYSKANEGLLLWIIDERNYYQLDIGRDTGILYRVIDGTRTQVASSVGVRLPHLGKKVYRTNVSYDGVKIKIDVDANRDGTNDIKFEENVPNVFKASRLSPFGLFRNVTDNPNTKACYDNVYLSQQGASSQAPFNLNVSIEVK